MRTKHYKLFGKSIVALYHQWIMSLDYSQTKATLTLNLRMQNVSDQYDRIIEGTYSKQLCINLLKRNAGRCETFVFTDTTNTAIGTASIMYKGGDDLEYRVRNADAFIYNVAVIPQLRGQGYAGEMVQLLMRYLKERGISKAYLAVSTDNIPAIRAYEKAGFQKEREVSFLRILRRNFPYHVV